ncbi:MAG: tetratricopeptide repeat protein, partial [Candidatus Hodarchaeales archaeon]
MFDQDRGLLTSDDRQSIIVEPDFLQSLMFEGEYLRISEIFKEIDTTIDNFFIQALTYLKLGKVKKAKRYLVDVKALTKDNPLALVHWHYLWSYYLTYGEGKFHEAIREANHALEMLENDVPNGTQWVVKEEDIIGKLNILLGAQYIFLGNYSEARSYLIVAKEIFEKNNSIYYYGRTVHKMGIMEYYQGNIEEALELYEEALLYKEQIGNPLEISYTFNVIAGVYTDKGDYKLALDYLHNALELLKDMDSGCVASSSMILSNIGFIEHKQGRLSKALQYYNEGLKIQKELDNPIWKANTLLNIACIQRLQADMESALENLNEARTIFQSINKIDSLAETQITLGLIFKEKGLYEKAREEIEKAVSLCLETSSSTTTLAASLIELAFVENEIGGSIRETIEPRFPLFNVGDNPIIKGFRLMLKGLITQQERNYGSAWNHWIEAISCKELSFLDLIKCYEALIELALQDWITETTEKNFQKLYVYLNKLESESTKKNLFPTTCKLLLLKAKIEQTRMNLSGAKELTEKCLDLAEEKGLPGYAMLARKEMEKLNDQKKLVQEEVIASIAEKTAESQETIRTYFQSFIEEITKNTPHIKHQLENEDEYLDKISAKKMETMNQVKKILKTLEENPLGVYQKDLPNIVGFSKA